MSSKIVNVDPTLYSPAFNEYVMQLLGQAVTNPTSVSINPVMSTVTIDSKEVTVEAKVEEDLIKAAIGLYTLPAVLRTALPYQSWEFIETVATKLGVAFGCGELELVHDITPAMVETEMEHVPFSAYRVDHITRWREHGVVCMTDVLMEDAVWVGPQPVERVPVVYPVLVVGRYLALNAAVTVPHNVTRQSLKKDDEFGPTVCGAVIYRSLGTAVVEQSGVTATVSYNGDRYRADVMGCVKAN
jgi:hypothetical protein